MAARLINAQFWRSSARFVWRVSRRAVAGLVWWLLDVAEIYSRFVVPELPPQWASRLAPYVDFLDDLTPYIVAVFILGAALYTFYEADRELHRNPKIVKNLKRFYATSGELLKRQVASTGELVTLRNDASQWMNQVKPWIAENMEAASLERFLMFRHHLPYNHGKTLNDEHQILLNGVSIYHENLQALIEHDEWR